MEPSCHHHHPRHPHHHHHLLHTVSAIYWLIDVSPSSARTSVCVWTRCDLSAGLSARVCASCDSVCWQLNQRGLDEWPANHCGHSVAIAIAHKELSLGFPEEQTSHNLILKSICLLVSIWLPPTLSLSPLPRSLFSSPSLCTFYSSQCQLLCAAPDLLYIPLKTTCSLPPLFPSFICNGGRWQLLCTDCCNLLVGYFHFSFVNNCPLLQYNYVPPCSNNNMLNCITHITLSHMIYWVIMQYTTEFSTWFDIIIG